MVIRYFQCRIQRLGEGFDTNCHSYESDNNFGYYRLRSDCVNDCYQDKLRKLCKVDRGLFMSESLIRKDYLVNGNDKMISCYDPGYNFQIYSIKRDCEKMCKPECYQIYYPFELDVSDSGAQKGFIIIMHGQYPDIFVEHIPKMSLICFICNFGSLLALWLGFSLFGIFNDIFTLISKVPTKYFYLNSLKMNGFNLININFILPKRVLRRCLNKIEEIP